MSNQEKRRDKGATGKAADGALPAPQQQGSASVPERALEPTGTPRNFGFPENPDVRQLRCWANQERFLAEFAKCGIVAVAAAEAGVTVANVEWWDSQDTYGFKKRKAWAAQVALGHIEKEINRRAMEGTDHPVIYKGEITRTYKEYSDNLLMFRAKRLDPAYKDNYDPRPIQQPVVVTQIIINPPAGIQAQVEATSYRVSPPAEEGEGGEVPGDDKKQRGRP